MSHLVREADSRASCSASSTIWLGVSPVSAIDLRLVISRKWTRANCCRASNRHRDDRKAQGSFFGAATKVDRPEVWFDILEMRHRTDDV